MRSSLLTRLVPAVLAATLVLACASVAMACPGCKDAIASQDPTHGGIVKGYFWSILFMMGTPYLVLASFCGWMYLKVRRARAEAARSAAPAGSVSTDGRRAPVPPAASPAGPLPSSTLGLRLDARLASSAGPLPSGG